MKFVTSLAIVLAAQSAMPFAVAKAAPIMNLEGSHGTRTGAFAGARFRLALGGKEAGQTRLGLTLAPTRQHRWSDGRQALGFGDGFELGVVSGEPITARVAGRRLTGGPALGTDEPRLGVSTLGYAGIAAGVIVAGFIVLGVVGRSDNSGD